MYPSTQNDDQKYSVSPPPSAPPPQFGQYPATGIPVSPTNQFYSQDRQPHPAIHAQPRTQVTWSSGLCDCCEDVPNCCITCWCPCITFGQIAEIVDKGSTSCVACGGLYALICSLTGCACLLSCFYRSKMRKQYMLPEHHCGDCFVHFCCETCSLCQEYRELKSRGFDMSIGWQGNVERHNRGVTMVSVAPVVQGGMSR